MEPLPDDPGLAAANNPGTGVLRRYLTVLTVDVDDVTANKGCTNLRACHVSRGRTKPEGWRTWIVAHPHSL